MPNANVTTPTGLRGMKPIPLDDPLCELPEDRAKRVRRDKQYQHKIAVPPSSDECSWVLDPESDFYHIACKDVWWTAGNQPDKFVFCPCCGKKIRHCLNSNPSD